MNVARTRRTRLVADDSDDSGQPRWALVRQRGGRVRKERPINRVYRAHLSEQHAATDRHYRDRGYQ